MGKYVNGNDVLPPELVAEIQRYVQGKVLYIPLTAKKPWGAGTGILDELQQRNADILMHYHNGVSFPRLAEMYCLSEARIRSIVYEKQVPGD